ncbi:dephospho-CoA kinase [Fibrobacter sp. UWB16]|uniref:dephospho-CoA kinase n=1 Tax=unclassified Fibrobacter TaxID=2634177 RepID=UPI000B51F7D2|nr:MULTISPECIES: dephospho-CoA kinase [unclassified Fibrobacter]OWV19116.1 dephospho-CoA kinase [Fibrobacter sp. UWB3]SOD12615.1 dephospho-CoA kinase [Fibrobacter sp. UWB16]
MLKIGITGSIGAGKSFVGALLRARNFQVLDADCKVHELYRDSAGLRAEMVAYFGEECLTPTGVNSALIADRVFADANARVKLEQIVYPYLNRAVAEFFSGEAADSSSESASQLTSVADKCRFVEAALFSRAPELVKMLDEIWIVDAPESARLERLVHRGLSESDAKRRIENQRGACALELFPGKRIRTVMNDGDKLHVEQQLDELLRDLH